MLPLSYDILALSFTFAKLELLFELMSIIPPTSLPTVVLVAALLGLGLAGALALARGGLDREARLPFGPCLALALWLCWLGSGGPPWPA